MNVNYSVIVVEDEAPIRRNLVNKINECNKSFIVVESFRNGKKAFEWLTNNSVDLIVTDIKMPNMDGLELSKLVRERFPKTHTIIISGYNNFEYAREAIKYKVEEYITKPVDIDELKNAILSIKDRLDKENPNLNKAAERIIKSQKCQTFIDDVCTYISKNYKDPLYISEISEKFDTTPENLTRLFKKCKEITLQKYIIQVRISEAKKIIRTYKELDIQSVGGIVGYPDPYYFSRIFKKYTSMSPSQYRKLYI